MLTGLALQAIGLGWVAAIAAPGMGYAQMGIALAVAGVGISLVFPVVANAVLSSVPPEEAGVASGTNSTMRELGGVFGVALLAAVFARHGVYSSRPMFVEGVSAALWVGRRPVGARHHRSRNHAGPEAAQPKTPPVAFSSWRATASSYRASGLPGC